MRQVIVYPGEDGQRVAECPTLPGCISQGKTKEDAIGNFPTLSPFADNLIFWHADVPEKDLVEMMVAGHRLQRANFDTGRVHRK